ncbi:hypothetical protein KDK95_14735 [Actinospica sp. MGRD01-02]|uniref:Uncharacterized protein n=1 Tax=Actinospica acidithermotolerans TaxID=2828514 RepID=A0A941EBU3_9ACTN|nr:hypothetical protein [Actinospica acidithermotolerans]MBR7827572.1 hypothetical protein [Actinospica acidithermotolerans]
MTIVDIETVKARTGRSLVDPVLFDRLSACISFERGMDRPTAERVMDQALAFLGTCAVHPVSLAPSKAVDIGWHTFVLHTLDYAAFCNRVAGRFIHHIPTDDENEAAERTAPCKTTAAIVAAGYVVDAPLWEGAANCSQCKDGCHDDPPPDPKNAN